jgi:putative phosphoesterase
MLVGVISDTHGYFDPRVSAAFTGVDMILHAGDVGGLHVLDALRQIAPVHAVYGNNDERLGGLGLPFRAELELAGIRVHLVHQLPDARPGDGTRGLVFGHSHRTVIEDRNGVLHVNPGAAGRAGFHRLQTVALLHIHGGAMEARIVELGAREAIVRRRAG